MLCLRLDNREDRKLFWDFKTESINKNMRYLVGLFAAFTAFLTVYNVFKPDVYFRVMLLAFALVLIMLLLIGALAKRWHSAGAYLMPLVFIYCFGGQAFWAYYEDTKFDPAEWTYSDYKVYVV